MNLTIDNVEVKNRLKFKKDIRSISNASITFYKDTAKIVIEKPYIIDEDFLSQYSKEKKAIFNYINEFRHYQFNQ